jgi:eukaryotic-like serine/threonine-protein kinase
MAVVQRIGRISLERTIGSGSFGRVYLAWDEDRQQSVAVKQLTRLGPEGLFRFKQEFRLLADLNHPNLVSLYELLAEGGELAFTMEFVDGQPFAPWVRSETPGEDREVTPETESLRSGPRDTSPSGMPTVPVDDDGGWAEPRAPVPSPLRTFDRLRKALGQLVAGIQALHSAGILHLDLKSNNVLVTREGRVVILDFGLSREEEVLPSGRGAESLQGTPSHVAPEVVQGQAATEACDWYAVGVMLFESLTGRLPFLGSGRDMIHAKVRQEAPRPQALCPGLPGDLAQLCGALLRRDPRERAGAAEILAALGGLTSPLEVRIQAPLVGREEDLEALRLALAGARGGHFRTLLLSGPFGVGKSALLRVFLKETSHRESRAVTLMGRCFEQETVPFKGMDGLVDALSHRLRRLPPADVEALLPRDLPLLVQLFPVLRQVPVLAAAAGEDPRVPEAPEEASSRRQDAFRALRVLLARMALGRSMVLALDDFQWADADTVALLMELIRPPEAPCLLLVVSYRDEGTPLPPHLAAFLEALREAGVPREERTLGPLEPPLAEALARSLVTAPERAQAIARESEGQPWLIQELAFQDGQAPGGGEARTSFRRLVSDRVQALPEPARDILHLLALAGYPLPWDLVRRTALDPTPGPDPVAILKSHHLVRISGKPAQRVLEVYHDRIRTEVLASLSKDQQREGHLRLAQALETSGRPRDSQALSIHYLAAGDPLLAAQHSAEAARQCDAALAFGRAAALYRRAIALLPAEDPRGTELRVHLATALVNAGHSWEAAEEYLALVQARPLAARRFLRRAAEEYFRSGHVAEGFRMATAVLEDLGLRIPSSPLRALLSFLYHRFRLTLRGMAFRERPAERIPEARLERLDALWSLAMGLGPSDLVRAVDFQTRHLLEALRTGEPRRFVRALAHEAALRSTRGVAAAPSVQRILGRTLALAEQSGNPEAMGRAQLAAAIAATAQGQWRAALNWADQAETTLDRCASGVVYETRMAQCFCLRNAFLLGDLPAVRRRYAGIVQESRAQGDLLTSTNLMIEVGSTLQLCADRPGQAHELLDQALAEWPRDTFLLQHQEGLVSRCDALLYEGRGAEALAIVLARWRPLERSFLMRAEAIRITATELRTRVHLATGQDRQARRWNRSLGKESCGYGRALAMKNQGVLLARDGRRLEGAGWLFEAEMGLVAAELHLHALCVRRVRGVLLGGRMGRDLVQQADLWMRARGILVPARMARALVPGLD